MGCKACHDMLYTGTSYPYRWKHATIELIACREHAIEIMEALNKAQATQEAPKPNGV